MGRPNTSMSPKWWLFENKKSQVVTCWKVLVEIYHGHVINLYLKKDHVRSLCSTWLQIYHGQVINRGFKMCL